MPQPISITVYGAEMKKLLESKCQMEKCNEAYEEQHLHELFNTVAAVVLQNDDLVVVKGRVIGVTKSPDGFFYYSIRVPTQSSIEYIVPMWSVFRYKEVAEWRLRNVYTLEEKAKLTEFFKVCTSKRNLRKISGETLSDYVMKILRKSMPTPAFVQQANLEGCSAVLGSSSMYVAEDAVTILRMNRPSVIGGLKVPQINTTGQILDAIKEVKPFVLFRRMFENAAETLAIIFISRLPNDRKITFEAAYEKMKGGKVNDILYF